MVAWERIEYLGELCRLCNKDDWCLTSPTALICARVKQCELPTCTFCVDGNPKRVGEAGWLHLLKRTVAHRPRCFSFRVPDVEYFQSLHDTYRANLETGQLLWWAQHLGVSPIALDRLGMGWCDEARGITFPTTRLDGRITGLQIRRVDGRKHAVSGSATSQGLFVPSELDPQRGLFLSEGASDCASLLSLGLQAAGRPSVSTDYDLVRRFVVSRQFQHIAVVGDNDPHGRGQAAAAELANYLRHFCQRAYLLIPPVKDIRLWVAQGAARGDLLKGLVNVSQH
jgi:hypothetical protein